MINYLLIIVGIIGIIIGGYFLFKFISDLTNKVQRLEKLLEDERFTKIEDVSKELDELNYSYYEILSDLSDRMDALTEHIDQKIIPSKVISPRQSITDNPAMQKDASISEEKDAISERKQILAMIDAGFDDNQIAKALGIGSGKVHIIRNLNN